MGSEELLVPVIIALTAGFFLGWLFVRAQVLTLEARYRAEQDAWKVEAAGEIRKDSVKRSRSTLKGKIAEQLAPILPEFAYHPADARFLGSPVDYVIFDGLTGVADEKNDEIRIVFLDVKQGSANLSRTQRVIRDAIEHKKVSFETLRIAADYTLPERRE
ncbi:MAG: endonuclease [Methanomicrobiales archaeon]|nr:endonuclease [Methanomicrobiales archaeon]